MNLCDINTIKPLLGRHGFHFSKRMGQNFLIEDWVPVSIANAAKIDRACGVLEIGPGIGPLTQRLAERAGRVVSVELDHRLLPVLAETLSGYPNTEIVSGDILKLNIPSLLDEKLKGLTPVACANLPYNITTPIITALLETNRFSSITIMIQREVAHRICAKPGTGDYGAFSLYCQYHANCEIQFDVPPSCFLPAPKVTSTVIRMLPYSKPPVTVSDEAIFFRLVKAAFAQRRKTLLNAISSAFGRNLTKDQIREIILACNFDENIRGERLSISDFASLTEHFVKFKIL